MEAGETTEPDEAPRRRSISRRTLIIGSLGLAGAATAAVVVERITQGGEQSAPPDESTETTAEGPPGSGPPVVYEHDVPRVPVDPATGVPGWPVDPAGAQLVQAPL